jgi:hypothetical protein
MSLRRRTIRSLPITRRRDGSPMTETVRTINRSETLRDIFHHFGRFTDNSTVHNELASCGLTVSDALINKIRKGLGV